MPLKVLVADDNEKNRKLLRVILSKTGFSVTEACNGKRAVELYSSVHHDVVLMDYRMPEMDGIEASKIIKSYNTDKKPLIFIVTSSAMAGDRERIMRESGCDDFFTKPVDYEIIVRRLKQKEEESN